MSDSRGLNEIPFKVLLKKEGNTFHYIMPEFGVVGSGTNADYAYEDFCKQRDLHFEKLQKIGADSTVVDEWNELNRLKSGLVDSTERCKSYYRKRTLWILLAVFVGFSLISLLIIKTISSDILLIGSKIDNKIDYFLDGNQEKQNKRIERFKRATQLMAPYVKEIKRVVTQ